MPIIAQRGGSPVALEELKGHLATLLRLENIGVLLGAGASVIAGGKTVHQLWGTFVDDYPNSSSFLRINDFVTDDNVNPDRSLRTSPNIELLGDALEIASIEWHRAAYTQENRTAIKKAIADLKRAVVKAAILHEGWWQSPKSTMLDPALSSHKSLLQKLTSARQPGQTSPWLFTTNYDLAIEWAAEAIELQVINGFLGTHDRKFSPQSFDLGLRNNLARGEARFGIYNIYLAKLHGSMTWQEKDNDITEQAASSAWPQLSTFLNANSDTTSMMVFPRAAKYLQTVGFALGELIRRFSEFLVRPQTALLVVGYGFGDDHLNRILLSALQNPTLQIVVYLPELNLDNPTQNKAIIQSMMSLSSPRITLVGGGPQAYFADFVSHLPDPIIYDEDAAKIRALLRHDGDAS